MSFKTFTFAASVFCLSTALFSVPSSHAGFEWKPAKAPVMQQKTYPPKYPAPAPAPAPAPVIEQVIESTAAPAVQEEPMPAKVAPVEEQMEQPAPTAPAAAPAMAPKAAPAMAKGEIVHGFGSDLPLAYALSQVAPPQYGYSFGDGVNPGYRVSWNGGKAWQDVIADMVAPLNLTMEVRDNKIILERKAIPMPRQAQPAPAPQKQSSIPVIQPPTKTVKRVNIVDPGPVETSQPIRLMKAETAARPVYDNHFASSPYAKSAETASVWQAKQGDSLRNTLGRWSNQMQVGVIWNATHDYEVGSNIVLNGTYTEAVKELLQSGIKQSDDLAYNIVMHEGSEVAKTLVIKDRS